MGVERKRAYETSGSNSPTTKSHETIGPPNLEDACRNCALGPLGAAADSPAAARSAPQPEGVLPGEGGNRRASAVQHERHWKLLTAARHKICEIRPLATDGGQSRIIDEALNLLNQAIAAIPSLTADALEKHSEIDVTPGKAWTFVAGQAERPTLKSAGSPDVQAADHGLAVNAGKTPRRILVVDDHPVIRQGLIELLHKESDITVIGSAGDGEQAIQHARELKPDVVLMDISMPVMNGIEATRAITSEMPGVQVIGLSMHEHAQMISAMRAAGAAAYVRKDGSIAELLATIRALPVTNAGADM